MLQTNRVGTTPMLRREFKTRGMNRKLKDEIVLDMLPEEEESYYDVLEWDTWDDYQNSVTEYEDSDDYWDELDMFIPFYDETYDIGD